MPTITASIDGSAVKAQSLAGNRRLQPLRYLRDCSDCFRLERLPGGACTHWKAPPCHGARQVPTSSNSIFSRSIIKPDCTRTQWPEGGGPLHYICSGCSGPLNGGRSLSVIA